MITSALCFGCTNSLILTCYHLSQDTDRPTSNPLPPQSEAFDDFKYATLVSAPDVFNDVAQQIPNFGTEQVHL